MSHPRNDPSAPLQHWNSLLHWMNYSDRSCNPAQQISCVRTCPTTQNTSQNDFNQHFVRQHISDRTYLQEVNLGPTSKCGSSHLQGVAYTSHCFRLGF